jgi:carbamoyltransferase
MSTEMDNLVIENFLFEKEKQPAWREEGNWREKYGLD